MCEINPEPRTQNPEPRTQNPEPASERLFGYGLFRRTYKTLWWKNIAAAQVRFKNAFVFTRHKQIPVNDAIGQPFFMVEKQIDHGLLQVLRENKEKRASDINSHHGLES